MLLLLLLKNWKAGLQSIWLSVACYMAQASYSCNGASACKLMYQTGRAGLRHPFPLQGFKQQTAKWPLQPIQAAAAYLAKHSRKAVVADFGCGDAELARMVPQETVHSLDLVSSAPGVIACNMADTPLGGTPSDSLTPLHPHVGQLKYNPDTLRQIHCLPPKKRALSGS